jgi:chromosome segregation ATPase
MTQSSGSNAAAAATALLVDRFVSASSADDARESLQGIVTALQATPTAEEDQLDPSIIWQEEETLEAFLQVLTTGEYKGIPVDQGPPLVCQIYAEFIKAKDSSIVLQKPQPGRLVQSLLDVICNTEEYAYSRVSALQVLQKICSKYPSVAQTHLLEVPNGLHRLADMFKEDNEQVRNEVLLLAKVIAQWPSCAKIWVFAEVCDSVIELAVQEGGLTNGNVLVMDCLDLLHSLLKHDASLSDLVWQSPIFANKLATLLDLRRGTEFLNPKKPLPTDDLDDILQSGNEGTAKPLIPALTREEEALLTKVLDLAGVMLSSETIRHTVWKRHLALGSLVWELSLLSPPPPGVPHVCAVPSANLQQQALNCVAESFSSLQTMQRHNGLDRLLYLVCTGGASTDFKEKLGLSQSALHVIRRTLSDEVAKETVMHTLAPPTSSDETSEPEPSVVLKLLNTVMENVSAGDGIDLDRRKINLLGSLGGLCVFMRDATTREMMLRITSPHALIDVILKSLETQEEFIALSFLRFLSEWMVKTPPVVEAVLSSTQSTSLSVLFGSNGEKGVLAGLLLGVAMEYMDDKESEKYGGWTRASILTMISKRSGGISGFMSELEDMKTSDLPWKACPLEQKTFFKWYNDQVLVVRSRIVQELAQGSDAEDDENQGTGSRALQKIVAQQSKELQELQAAAAVAKSEIESRDSQLSIWKRRMESNPTQLDDMLSEFSDKNVELETDVSKLRKELESLRESHDEQLLKKEEEIRGLTTQIDESRLREEEARSDSDRLRGELAALSSAYSNLEEDYNVSQLSRSAAALHAGVVDSGEDGQQQEGEVSSQGKGVTLSEADTLRAENTRLRNDARAADEVSSEIQIYSVCLTLPFKLADFSLFEQWMQLAHQRMGEIGSQNLVLQQELDSMKAMLPETTSQQTDNREVGEFLQEANDRCSELEKEILALKANHGSEGGAMDTPLEQEQRARKELEEKLENAQIDVVSALDSLGQSKSKTEELLREIDDLKSELQLANANITALNEERRQLERKITLQGAEGQVEDEGELLASLQADNQAKQEELDSLRSSVKYLQDEVASARSAVGLSLNTDDESAKSDSAEKVGGQESSQETRGQELEQLRAANKAAQDWMESAVEHHRMLTEQVANLTADKEDLIRQNTARQGGDDNETAKILQQRLDSQDAELRQREGELRIIQAEASLRTSAYEATKEALESEVSRLEAELLSRTDESNSIRNTSEEGLEDLKLEVESIFDSSRGLEKIVDEQKIEIEEMRNQISVLSSERDTQGAEVNDLTVKLKEFEEWAAAAQERLSLLATEKEAVEQKLALSEATSTNSSSGLDELAETNEKLSLDKADLSIRLVTLEEECGVQSARLSELELLLEEKDMEIISLQESCQQATADLAETEKEAFVVTQQWQETAAELEVNINELKEALSNQENEASDVVKQWTQRCEELEQTVEGFESEMQAFSAGDTSELTAKIDELESTISSLEHTLEAQQQEGIEAVGQWSSRCGELDDVVKDLSSQCDSLVADKESLMERLAEADESSEKELELKESMSLQIELFETEATSSKSRLVEFAEESGKTIEGLENEVESLEATIEEKEEVIRKAEEGLEDLRVKMADMQATSIKSAEITTGKWRESEGILCLDHCA